MNGARVLQRLLDGAEGGELRLGPRQAGALGLPSDELCQRVDELSEVWHHPAVEAHHAEESAECCGVRRLRQVRDFLDLGVRWPETLS